MIPKEHRKRFMDKASEHVENQSDLNAIMCLLDEACELGYSEYVTEEKDTNAKE